MADLEEFMNFRAETQRTLIRTTGVVRIRCMLKQGKENERDVVSTYSSIYIMPCSIALAIAMLDRGKPHPQPPYSIRTGRHPGRHCADITFSLSFSMTVTLVHGLLPMGNTPTTPHSIASPSLSRVSSLVACAMRDPAPQTSED